MNRIPQGRVAPSAARPFCPSSKAPERNPMPPAAHPDVPTPCRLPRHRRTHPVRFPAFDLGRRPRPHGPRRRGPASRLPYATRRRGPAPPSVRSPIPTWPGRLSSTPCLAPTARTHTARRLRRHRPHHAVHLAPLAAGVSLTSASWALASQSSSSLPVTSFIFRTLPAMTAMSCPVPVTAAMALAPVHMSVMTIMARRLHRGVLCTSRMLAAPLRDPTCPRARRVVPHDARALEAIALDHPIRRRDAAAGATAFMFGSPVRAPPVTGSCTSPSCNVHYSVTASDRAFGSVPGRLLSVSFALPATQSPWWLPPAGFSGPDPLSLVPSVLPSSPPARLWFSHPTRPRRCRGDGTLDCAMNPLNANLAFCYDGIL